MISTGVGLDWAPGASGATLLREHNAQRVAVMIPCFNEEQTIGRVLDNFREVVPTAQFYVFDNNSGDRTAEVSRLHGAHVVLVPRRGKGNVVRAMLSKISADIYVLVDGDDTYPASQLPDLMAPVLEGRADMIVGARLQQSEDGAFRPLHQVGNKAFSWLVGAIFGSSLRDILSGYRVFNQRVARSLPVVSSGFEVEAEISIQCLYYGLTVCEMPVAYRARPAGSPSKLHTVRDGTKILLEIFHLLRAYKPLTFFGSLGLFSLCLYAIPLLILPPLSETPTTLNQALMLGRDIFAFAGVALLTMGIMLHSINYRVKELHCILTKEERRIDA